MREGRKKSGWTLEGFGVGFTPRDLTDCPASAARRIDT